MLLLMRELPIKICQVVQKLISKHTLKASEVSLHDVPDILDDVRVTGQLAKRW